MHAYVQQNASWSLLRSKERITACRPAKLAAFRNHHRLQRTKDLMLYKVFNCSVSGKETLVVAHREDTTQGARCFYHGFAILNRSCHRLLAEDINSRSERGNRVLAVKFWRRCNNREISVSGKRYISLLENPRTWERLRQRTPRSRRRAGKPCDERTAEGFQTVDCGLWIGLLHDCRYLGASFFRTSTQTQPCFQHSAPISFANTSAFSS